MVVRHKEYRDTFGLRGAILAESRELCVVSEAMRLGRSKEDQTRRGESRE